MAMRVKHVQRAPNLVDEIEMTKQYDESAPVIVHLHIHREIIIREHGERHYVLYLQGSIYKDDVTIQEFEDCYNYYYHGRNFRQLMKGEFSELRRCLKRLNRISNNVSLIITKDWEVIEY